MDPLNYLQELSKVVTGNVGFKRRVEIPLRDFHLASTGALLTTTITTNPGWDIKQTNATVLSWFDAIVVPAAFNWAVPDDYDDDNDYLRLILLVESDGAVDTPTMDSAIYRQRAGAALSADLNPTLSAATSAALQELTINADGNGVKGGDALTWTLFPSAHTTDTVDLYGAWIEYRSDLVTYLQADR